jgi:RimJ/RimL family protein N-acetyltransferase
LTEEIFANTKIVKLHAPVFKDNVASIQVLEKCVYLLEGNLKNAIFKNGRFYDELIYGKFCL